MTALPKSTVSMSTVMRDISDALSLDRNDRKEVILISVWVVALVEWWDIVAGQNSI